MSEEQTSEVFDGAHRDVRLGEKSYRLWEPPAKTARRFRRWCLDLEKRQAEAEKAQDMEAALDIQDEVLDAIFQFSEQLEADREYIENHATERQMLMALRACRELVNDPLASAAADMQAKTKKPAARKRNSK